MSSYVESVLQPGEQVRLLATLHWILYVPGVLVLICALAVWLYAGSIPGGETMWMIVAGVLAAIAVIMLFRAWFERWVTEIAVTDRRVIFKTGFIRRDTNEMQMDKVESVRVDQSILGRIFDYGDITVLGTGKGEFTRLKTIAAPLDMRNQITGV